MMQKRRTHTPLHEYVELDEGFYAAYEQYQADEALVEQIRARLPVAHVVTPSRHNCSDCARNLPKMARIAEGLPGWTWEVFPSTDEARRQALHITHVPTFIVYEVEGGRELGRIVENPASGSLEQDLLEIARKAHRPGQS
jgi:hypothetical protein